MGCGLDTGCSSKVPGVSKSYLHVETSRLVKSECREDSLLMYNVMIDKCWPMLDLEMQWRFWLVDPNPPIP